MTAETAPPDEGKIPTRHYRTSWEHLCADSGKSRQIFTILLAPNAANELTCLHVQVDEEKGKLENDIDKFSASQLHEEVSEVWSTVLLIH